MNTPALAGVEFESKIVARETLAQRLDAQQRPLVFTNGCFDILHRGHVTYLAQAKALGKTLLVALNSDASVKRLNKGPERPINILADRMAVIAALASVSLVTWFEEDTPLETIVMLRPDILVKGGDWTVEHMVGAREVQAYGGRVESIPFQFDRSTTALVNKLR